jgi:hypothetical protein
VTKASTKWAKTSTKARQLLRSCDSSGDHAVPVVELVVRRASLSPLGSPNSSTQAEAAFSWLAASAHGLLTEFCETACAAGALPIPGFHCSPVGD